jgi:predicted MFS family arabinose efflux permease
MVALALALALALVPESRDPHASGLDLPGAALSIAGLTALLHGLIAAPSRGWTDPFILGAFGASAVALGAFAAWEPRTATPTLDVRLFRNPRFSVASGAIALAFFGLFGVLFATSQYLQNVHGFAPFEAGLWSLPVAGGLAIGGPLGARLTRRPARSSPSPAASPRWPAASRSTPR